MKLNDQDAAERAAWLENRRKNIGSSESAALLGVSPWRTRFELWCAKAGLLTPDDEDDENERMMWGHLCEMAIAEAVRRKIGWHVRKVHRYIEHPRVPGMGASLDFEVLGHPDGPGVLEAKIVDRAEYYRTWTDGQPPLPYEVQVQHQIGVTNRGWGAIAAMVGGNTLQLTTYHRHDGIIRRLEDEVPAFWQSIAAGQAPPPDYEADAETISDLLRVHTPGKVVDLPDLRPLVGLYELYGEFESEAKARRKQLRAALLHHIGDAELARIAPDCHVTAKTVPGGLVQAFERQPYRKIQVKDPTAAKARRPKTKTIDTPAETPALPEETQP